MILSYKSKTELKRGILFFFILSAVFSTIGGACKIFRKFDTISDIMLLISFAFIILFFVLIAKYLLSD